MIMFLGCRGGFRSGEKEEEQRPKSNWIQSPRGSSGRRECSFSFENRREGWQVSVVAKQPEVLRVGVEGVHAMESLWTKWLCPPKTHMLKP